MTQSPAPNVPARSTPRAVGVIGLGAMGMGVARSLLRKGQELVLTLALEACLSKRRILEIYLNSVEWGEGVFGAEAAAQGVVAQTAEQLVHAVAAVERVSEIGRAHV